MTDGNTRKKAQAVFFSLVMVLSMVGGSVALAGSAAADTTTIGVDGTDIDIGDEQVNVGENGTTQTISLEKVQDDGANEGGNVTISASAPDSSNFVFDSPSVTGIEVHPDGGSGLTPETGETPDITSSINEDGAIVIDLQNNAVGETVDITLEVDLQLANYELQDGTAPVADQVTYTAETNAEQTYTDTFDLIPAEPTVTDASVDTEQPNWVIVTLNESVETTTDNPENAFTISGFEQATGVDNVIDSSGAEGVDGLDLNDDQVALVLNDFVTSNDGGESDELADALEATGSNGVALSANTDVNVAANNSLHVNTSGVRPLFDEATVGDTADNKVDVTFTEPVAIVNDDQQLAEAFGWGSDLAVSTNDGDTTVNGRTVTLTLSGAVSADADTREILSTTNLGDQLEGNDAGTNGVRAANLSSEDVENNVVPTISNAEVTYDGEAGQNYLNVTYDSNITVDGNANDIANAFSLDVQGNAAIDKFVEINDDTVVLSLDPIPATNDDLTQNEVPEAAGLDYTASGATDDIVSTAPSSQTAAEDQLDVGVTNNVKPVVSSVTLNDNTEKVTIDFTEDVSFADGVNPDTYATAQFELSDGTTPLQGAVSSGDVVLTFENELAGNAQEELTYTANDGIVGQDGSTAVTGFEAETVTNNEFPAFVENAEISHAYDAEADNGVTPYEVTVEFNENLNQVGTDSEVATAFDLELNGPDSNPRITDGDGDAVDVDEDADTITFTVTADKGDPADLDSSSELLASAGNGLSYDGSAANANNPIELGSEEPDSFETTVFNDIEPLLEDTDYALAAEDNSLTVTFTEPVSAAEGEDQAAAFDITGDDGPEISNVNIGASGSANEVTLNFQEAVAEDDTDIGNLEFTNGDAIVAAADETPARTTTVGVTGPSGVVNPAIQKVVFDDADVNSDADETNGQMLLYFDEDVHVNANGGDSIAGLEFQSSQTNVSIDLRGSIIDSDESEYENHPDNVLIVGTESASGSLGSTVQEGETLDDVELVVSDPGLVGIQTAAGHNIADDNVAADNIHNEIAGDLDSVDTLSLDVEIVPTTSEGTNTQNLAVTVEGLEDSSDNAIKTVDADLSDVSIVDADGDELTTLSVTSIDRFDDTEVNVAPYDGTGGALDNVVGEEISAEYAGSSSDNATVVHEAYNTDVDGYYLTSMPMPGEVVKNDAVGAVQTWNATSDQYEAYGETSDVNKVHRGLFVNGNTSGGVIGYAFDESVDSIGANSVEMTEGWNVVSSNYNINDDASVTYDTDLAFSSSPAASSDDVRLWKLNTAGTTVSTSVDSDGTVQPYDAYYVYMHQSNDRPIVQPEYDEENRRPVA